MNLYLANLVGWLAFIFKPATVVVTLVALSAVLAVSSRIRRRWPDVEDVVSLLGWGGTALGGMQILIWASCSGFDAIKGKTPDLTTSAVAAVAILWMSARNIYRLVFPRYKPEREQPGEEAPSGEAS